MLQTHVELRGSNPDVLVLRAVLAPLRDDLARLDRLAGDVLEPGSGDPAGRVLRVRLDERLEQRASTLDVAAQRGQLSQFEIEGTESSPDLGVRFEDLTLQAREVAFRVNRRGAGHRVGAGHLLELDLEHGAAGLSNLGKVLEVRRGGLESVRLCPRRTGSELSTK